MLKVSTVVGIVVRERESVRAPVRVSESERVCECVY